MYHGFNGHALGMGWGWIIGIFILVAAIIIIVYVVRQNNTVHRQEAKTPLDILKERYARGEIDKTEFEERKKDL
ncbi:MAG: SHOCT domain-containing protein [Bacteroidales bacterium]|nr:SHOCT domain-containing protein [Bacteroidales bacterium]MDT8432833.1 SHOCT domain-containing protein [Bacteroidales bacterium]